MVEKTLFVPGEHLPWVKEFLVSGPIRLVKTHSLSPPMALSG